MQKIAMPSGQMAEKLMSRDERLRLQQQERRERTEADNEPQR